MLFSNSSQVLNHVLTLCGSGNGLDHTRSHDTVACLKPCSGMTPLRWFISVLVHLGYHTLSPCPVLPFLTDSTRPDQMSMSCLMTRFSTAAKEQKLIDRLFTLHRLLKRTEPFKEMSIVHQGRTWRRADRNTPIWTRCGQGAKRVLNRQDSIE